MKRFYRSHFYLPFLGIFLVLQFIFSRVVIEPYPSFTLPLFGAIPVVDNLLPLPVFEAWLISADNDSSQVFASDLLPQLRPKSRERVMMKSFGLNTLNPQEHVTRSESFIKLLKHNIRRLCMDRSKCQLHIRWTVAEINVTTGGISSDTLIHTEKILMEDE